MLKKIGEHEEARRSRNQNVKKHLLQRLSSPSIVNRYETGYNRRHRPEVGSDIASSVREKAQILPLQPIEAMILSRPLRRNLDKDYLVLRHEQNLAWAQDRFDKGVSFAKAALQPSATNKEALIRKAETCYKEGLEMIPHHAQILTAYGALCANDGRLELAKEILQKVIAQNEDDSGDKSAHDCAIKDAKTYLSVIESKLHALRPKNTRTTSSQMTLSLSNKAEKAVTDALAERAFALGNEPKINHSSNASKYQLLSSPSSESSSSSISEDERKRSRRRRKRRRRDHSERSKKRYRRKEKSRSRHRDSREDYNRKQKDRYREEDSNDDSHSSSNDASRERRKKYRKKDKKRRKKRSSRSRSNPRSD